MQPGGLRQTFTVTAVNGAYAAETLNITDNAATGGVLEISPLIESLPASATVELWLLRVDGDPATAGDWKLALSWNATGLQDLVPLAFWRGAEIRVKSGGTSGTAAVSATWS